MASTVLQVAGSIPELAGQIQELAGPIPQLAWPIPKLAGLNKPLTFFGQKFLKWLINDFETMVFL